ncbi:MAG: hypothetical protein HDS13_03820 [Bacteroides sp.]|nr:hypothetical protein [Bacteroides sp.]
MKNSLKEYILNLHAKRIKKGRVKYWRDLFTKRNSKLQNKDTKLLPQELDIIQKFYSKYNLTINPVFHQFYKYCKGTISPEYIPDDLYYTYIDPFFNDWVLAKYLDNKTFYHQLFPTIPQPKTVVYRQNLYWFNSDQEIITEEIAIKTILRYHECFLKQATDSEGGKNIYVITSKDSIQKVNAILKKISGDIIVQEGLKQSSILSKLNSSSVNTLRLLTLLRLDGSVKLCSTSLRMGINGAKVDNASSGGITVGVQKDGTLNSYAYSADGIRYDSHPTSNVKFNSVIIPNFSEVVEIVKREAKKHPHFRLISWDIALDQDNQPVLIEANLKYGELEFHQLNNGPIFGDDTKTILDEVFL